MKHKKLYRLYLQEEKAGFRRRRGRETGSWAHGRPMSDGAEAPVIAVTTDFLPTRSGYPKVPRLAVDINGLLVGENLCLTG